MLLSLVRFLPYAKFGFSLILILAISFFWYDYKRLHYKNKELENTVNLFQDKIDDQQRIINQIRENIQKQEEIRNEIRKDVEYAQRDVDNLYKIIKDHNFARIAERKSRLLQNKINNGTIEILRCFELVTGSKPNKNETNKSCPNILDTKP